MSTLSQSAARFLSALSGALVLASCAGVPAGENDEPADIDDPVLRIDTPARGTIAESSTITVTGQASDEGTGIESVTVNGQPAQLDESGGFRATVSLIEGILLIETIARDAAGNETNDIRATLLGQFADGDQPVENALVGHVTESSFSVLNEMVVDLAESTDFATLVQNPVVDAGGSCLGVELDVQSVDKSSVTTSIKPRASGIDMTVIIHDVDADLFARYNVACLGGSAPVKMTATSFRIDGSLHVGLSGLGTFDVELSDVTGVFQGYNLAVGSIPQAVVDLFEGPAQNKVRDILIEKIEEMVPSLGESFLADFAAAEWKLPLAGSELTVSVSPSKVTLRDGLIEILVRGSARIIDGIPASYLSTPRPIPGASTSNAGLQVSIADDIANQLLASVWVNGLLDKAVEPGLVDQIQGLFGEQADDIQFDMLLPPVVQADPTSGTVRLIIGDIVVKAANQSEGAGTLLEFALSATIDLTAKFENGVLRLVTGEPKIHAKLIEKSPLIVLNIDDSTIAALAEIVVRQLAENSDSLLGTLAIPSLGPVSVSEPIIMPADGYLRLEADLGL